MDGGPGLVPLGSWHTYVSTDRLIDASDAYLQLAMVKRSYGEASEMHLFIWLMY